MGAGTLDCIHMTAHRGELPPAPRPHPSPCVCAYMHTLRISVLRAIRQPTVRHVAVTHTTKRNMTIGRGMPVKGCIGFAVISSWHKPYDLAARLQEHMEVAD